MRSSKWYSPAASVLNIMCIDRNITLDYLAGTCGCSISTFLVLFNRNNLPHLPRWVKIQLREFLNLTPQEERAFNHLLEDNSPTVMIAPTGMDFIRIEDYEQNQYILSVKDKTCKYRKCFAPVHLRGEYHLQGEVLHITPDCYCCAKVTPGETCTPQGFDFEVLHPDCTDPLVIVKRSEGLPGVEFVSTNCATCGQYLGKERASILMSLGRFRWLKKGKEKECKQMIRKKSLEAKQRQAKGVADYYLLTLKPTLNVT